MAGYLVKYGNSNVYVAGSETYAIHNAKVSMKTDEVSTFQFTMPPTHPLRNTVTLRDQSHPVRVTFDGELVFCGFITRTVATITGELEVTCSSDLALLGEVHVRLTDDGESNSNQPWSMSARDLFTHVIIAYNAKVATAKRFTIGHNIGRNDVGTIKYQSSTHRSVEVNTESPSTALEIISRSILDPYGCVLKVWYDGSTRYIGLYTAAPDTNSQRIEFTENMKTFQMDESDDELYTGCYPIGGTGTSYKDATTVAIWQLTQAISVGDYEMHLNASSTSDYDWVNGDPDKRVKIGDIFRVAGMDFKANGGMVSGVVSIVPVNREEGFTGSPRAIPSGTSVYYKGHSPDDRKSFDVSLEDVSDGTYYTDYVVDGPIVYDRSAVQRYGLRTMTAKADIYYGPNLLEYAIGVLGDRTSPTYTITVDAVDMALYKSGYRHLLAGQKVRVVNAPYDVNLMMQVTQADLDLDNPSATRYTLGSYKGSVTRMIRRNKRETDRVGRELQAFKLDKISRSRIWSLY